MSPRESSSCVQRWTLSETNHSMNSLEPRAEHQVRKRACQIRLLSLQGDCLWETFLEASSLEEEAVDVFTCPGVKTAIQAGSMVLWLGITSWFLEE